MRTSLAEAGGEERIAEVEEPLALNPFSQPIEGSGEIGDLLASRMVGLGCVQIKTSCLFAFPFLALAMNEQFIPPPFPALLPELAL